MNPSPALDVHFPAGTSVAARDSLLARLSDFDLVAIQEDDVAAPTAWVVHFGTPEGRDAALSVLREAPGIDGLRLQATDVPDDDWARRTQADLPAIQVGRVIVAPPWDLPSAEHRAPSAPPSRASDPRALRRGLAGAWPSNPRQAEAGNVIVEIEPSRGFGTGHHQSTRLCLVLLQNRDLAGRTVVDVGTGSGVLAIAAAKLGAAFVSAIDTDPDAVDNARENIARNGVSSTVEAHVRDVQDAAMAAADVVTANLTGTLLARHAAALRRLVKLGGVLVASGFTLDERRFVEDAFGPELAVNESAEEDGWWAFVFARGAVAQPFRAMRQG